MKVRNIIYLLLFLSATTLFSQTTNERKKISFIIHCTNPATSIQKYEDAANNYGKLDQFRFYDKRRTINFKKSDVSIELYSAKELLDTYQKAISPFTIKDRQKYKEVWFVFTEDEKSLTAQYE